MVKTYQLPEWMIGDKRYLLDTRHPDKNGKPTRYEIAKKFDTINSARRYANRVETPFLKTKIIELISENTNKSKNYLVYIKVKKP